MKIINKSCLLILLIVFNMVLSSYAQNKNLRFEHLGIEDGLSSNDVTSIVQDHEGYIWIGTSDGLNKYDGYTFTKYKVDPFDSTSIAQNLVYTIWEDQQGFIWTGSFEGLCRFDRNTGKFTRYKPDPKAKFSDPNIDAINEDADGMMWLGSASGGLCRFDPRTGKFLPENFAREIRNSLTGETKLHGQINCIYKDRSGALWVGNNEGLHQVNPGAKKAGQPSTVSFTNYVHEPLNPNSLGCDTVASVIEDHQGILWIATSNGLNSFNRETHTFKRYLHDPKNIYSISSNNIGSFWGGLALAEDNNGNLWIPTNNGLNELNKERTKFTVYFHNPADNYSLSSNNGGYVLIDQAGVLWVGINGINKANLNENPFNLIRHNPTDNNSLSNNEVTAILEDSSGIAWIGTYGGGLNRWDRRTNQFTRYRHDPTNSKSLSYDIVNAILKDRHGQLWICDGDVLSLLNKKTGGFTHYNSNERNYQDEDSRSIYSITEDGEGLLWLGTGNGIKRFDEKTGKFTHYYHVPGDTTGISDYTAKTIFADSRDNIWIGFGSVATDRLDKRTGRFTHFKYNPLDSTGISSNIVNDFYGDSKGNIWIGTFSGGLCYFDYQKNQFSTLTDKEGLPDNSVYSILEDNNHQLWLGTGNGLSRFDPITKKFTNYDVTDGLQSNIFYAGNRQRPAHCKGKDGILYFGGAGGFNFFDPSQIKTNTILAPVVITQFKLFDKLVKGANELKEIVLNHNQNYFSFEFSSLSYYNPAKNQYAYKLVGVDKDWVYSGSRRYAAYTNIAPGTYTFTVKGTGNDMVWNEKGISIKIVIQPPWWRTWWAYLIYGLLFLAVIFMIDRYQKKTLLAKERTKAREKELAQAKEIEKAYHELKTTQSQLIQSEKMASLGELTAGIAHEIQNPLNFVNNFSDVNTELLTELNEEIEKGNYDDAKAIAKNVIENEQKINHHGKRADSIVKGMLQHSRTSTGIKEPSDINKLADEYLRLTYQGLRAKEKNFNATLNTDFDASIGTVNIVPQDIGRVLLNLYNNAFYVVQQKQKELGSKEVSLLYEPTVSVSTKKMGDTIFIYVKDNGPGIPQKVLDKIFQPFFTTKPTGQGTGLGLSLSYDIIKAHGGEIKVETKEEEGVEFIIQLPL